MFLNRKVKIEKKGEAEKEECSKFDFFFSSVLNIFGRKLSVGEDGHVKNGRMICTIVELFRGESR